MKISHRKCQLFRKELQYMGNMIFIQDKRVYIRPLCSRLEAIQRYKGKDCPLQLRVVEVSQGW